MKLTQKARKAAREATEGSSPSKYALHSGPPHVTRLPDVLLYNGRTLVQPRMPALLAQYGLTESRQDGRAPPPVSVEDRAAQEFADEASSEPDIMWSDPTANTRQNQASPCSSQAFGRVLQETKSLRDLEGRRQQTPSCHCLVKIHNISIVRFSCIEDLELQFCSCAPVAVQLMRLGAFACSPILPSLAVDLRVLEFTMKLFLQVSPNNTAYTIALENVLADMGFQLHHQARFSHSLRRRFGHALMWYTHLRNLLKQHYTDKIDTLREQLLVAGEPDSPNTPAPPRGRPVERSGTRSTSGTPTPRGRGSWQFQRSSCVVLWGRRLPLLPSSPPRSEDLQLSDLEPARPRGHPLPEVEVSRLPQLPQLGDANAGGSHRVKAPKVPFSGAAASTAAQRVPPGVDAPPVSADISSMSPKKHEADVVICTDTCFTQKKNKSPTDPYKKHPDSHFVSEEQAARTEEYIDGVRNVSDKNESRRKRAAGVVREVDEEDGYEYSRLPLPRSVLDGCEASFKAADEKREKASTEVLWLVNMHSAGEKQFYVIALLETFFQHIPRDIHVGLLYDVACAFERSCLKWGFLDRFMDRLVFAVSVFHVFGHEWACQLLFHPRKRWGFGFSNGEGAERFWNAIRHLITHLRICGYHNRLYTLDSQIEQADKASLLHLGEWIARRYKHSLGKRAEATKALCECGKSKDVLRDQWNLQVAAQTKPLPRRQKTRGQQAVNAKYLNAVEAEDDDAAMYEREFKQAQAALTTSVANLRRKEAALGVNEYDELEALATSEYMRARMNARALKLRLRERLRARKFEMELWNAHSKLHAHTASAVKHREPTITKLANEYNKLCNEVSKLIREGKAPRGSIAPLPIPAKGLWKLDVDDVIFQDVGLDDGDNTSDEPPLWLCDEQVRAGIKVLLELDRCEEEDARLRRENEALRVWFAEEWKVSVVGIQEAASEVDKYHLQLHQDDLVRLAATWDKYLPDFGAQNGVLPEWGPSQVQLARCRSDAHMPARGEDRHYRDGDSDDEEDDEDSDGEEEEYETLEAVARADVYQMDEHDY
ncbi:hypothetical protein B0H14DRAFT_3521899 [Mycena olivaceomarginata]|nr:hypothetical protein B0H14DRAFT_3521899 [Mycena olivaceomarginata]